jgi:hypothetical protein
VVSTLTIALLNLVASSAVVLAVASLVRLAHRLPARGLLEADVENIAEALPLSLIARSERNRESPRRSVTA